MSHMTSAFHEDDDGWFVVACACGWDTDPMPNAETAADVFGDHCYSAGVRETRAVSL